MEDEDHAVRPTGSSTERPREAFKVVQLLKSDGLGFTCGSRVWSVGLRIVSGDKRLMKFIPGAGAYRVWASWQGTGEPSKRCWSSKACKT